MLSREKRSNLHVLYSFPGRLGRGGVGKIAWHQITSLVELGVEVSVFCGTCDRAVSGVAQTKETLKVGRWRIPYRLIGSARAFWLHDCQVASALERLAETVTLVHCWPLGALETLRASRRLGIRAVLERPNTHTRFAYQVVEDECKKLGLNTTASPTHAFSAARLAKEELEYSLADRLACPSKFVAKTFLDRGFQREQIALHQYGYDPTCFSPAPSTRRREDDTSLTAVFVGSCEPRKGLHYALQAWFEAGAARLGRFHICGEFVPGFRRRLSQWLDDQSIVELGFTRDVASIMRISDVLILPSVEEGSALVTYEARACGCVPVVSDATGARCEHMREGLVHRAGDVRYLRAHIRRLMEDPLLLARLRERSLSGLDQLTWSAAGARLRDVYLELVSDKPAVGSVERRRQSSAAE